ncbi:IclR family transcriptional regulator C-terminal domain-containing protein [Streptomyces sp. NPDC016309]|uniref:IclR family transcriptional regulator domain-containing protein n=1 Tax=Streptomyces sp. NPDC016309 TaxID=3364965 RepID=UPI003701591B
MSRYDGPRSECSQPPVPAGLTALLEELEGKRDHWDRPDGTWGPAGPAPEDGAGEERARVNSLYRLGTKALRRDELSMAADWLGRAAERGHPGALFRLAVVVGRRYGEEGRDDAAYLVAEAARLGHGDARVLLREVTAGVRERDGTVQDPEFIDEVRAALGRPRAAPLRDASAVPAGDTTAPTSATGTGTGTAPGTAAGPAPESTALRTPSGPAPDPSGPPPGASVLATAGGLWVPGRPGSSRLWTPAPLRPASLTGLAQQVPDGRESAQRWQQAMRALDVLHAIGGTDGPMSTVQLAHGTGLDATALERLLAWLSEQGLVTAPEPGAYAAGPLLRAWAAHEGTERENALREVLSGLRDRVGAAVYVGRYTDGEVRITQYAAGPRTPAVREYVDFREAAHASAVGKSLLAQLDFDGRMDHLHRRRPVPLTPRTITDHRHLFRALDHHGPQAAQFDLLEYSNDEVCVAFPLTVDGRAGAVALSLPAAQQHRLIEAADALSNRSATLLATLLLAEDPPEGGGGAPGDAGDQHDDDTEVFVRTGARPAGE